MIDPALDQLFREEVVRHGWNPDDAWIGGYVDAEWRKSRSYLTAYLGDVCGKRALEVGSNVGATAIMLSRMGAKVTAVEADRRYLAISQRNAARYGESGIEFVWVPCGRPFPFAAASFDFVTCNSVLEYVEPRQLPPMLKEIDRVLAPDGVLLVLGTSNRLVPREVHSCRWLSNYIPVACDRFLGPRQRGIFPWQITRRLSEYEDLARGAGTRAYFNARSQAGDGIGKVGVLWLLAMLAPLAGLSCGALTPSFFLALRKRSQRLTHNA